MPRKVQVDAQQQYLKSEMDSKDTVIYQSNSKDGETSPIEMSPSVYQTHSEISGNPRSEVCGGQIPAEVAGCDVAEMDSNQSFASRVKKTHTFSSKFVES